MFYQQGDVILEKVNSLPGGVKKLDHVVLAEGEVTGHSHRLAVKDDDVAELYERNVQLFVRVKKPVKLLHQEHKTIDVPEGYFKVRKVKEYDHFIEESREVLD